jgi:hypothetical protein
LIRVTTAVVQTVGLKDKPQLAKTWTAVADDIKVFARTSCVGSREP